jgi:integrase
MARGINKLSVKAVQAAKEPGLYGDGGGLYLQVSDVTGTGITKAWVFRYMLAGRARKMGLGPEWDVPLAKAREKARDARELLRDGIDPIEAKRAERDARRKDSLENIEFKEATEKYLTAHESGWKNAKHRQQWRNTLETYAYKKLGDRPVKAIDAPLINDCVADIWKDIPETASRVRQRIERVCQWVRDGMPLPTTAKSKRVKHHAALPWQEVPAFMVELRTKKAVSAQALEFTILTAARTGETIGAKWDEIDLHAKVWTIPADRMKAGKEHRVPLSDRAIQILGEVPRESGSPYVFPGTKAKSPLSNMSMLEMVRGMRPGVTVHGFRSTFKDWAAEATNHPNIVSEAALAHTVKDAVEKAYRRGELIEKRARLMRDWAAFCTRPPVDGGNVVDLATRGRQEA